VIPNSIIREKILKMIDYGIANKDNPSLKSFAAHSYNIIKIMCYDTDD